MTAFQNVRKTLTDPIYAAVGAADLAVSRVRTASEEAGKKASELRGQIKPNAIVTKAQAAATDGVEQVQALPTRVEEQGKAAYAQAESSYADLSKRGAGVVSQLRSKQQKQVDVVVGQGKSTVADVRKAVEQTQARATKTVLAGRKEAAKQVSDAAQTVQSVARTEVRSTAAREANVEAKPVTKPAAQKAPARRTAKKAPAKRAPRKSTASKSTASKSTASKSTASKA